MSADRVVHRLIEEPEDDPLGIGPLDQYAGPIEFNHDVKDILDHALFLKQQCEQAGALNPRVIGEFASSDLHRAFLRLACEELDDEVRVDLAVKRLRRHMHSIWR
jgi:hypothetical protein